MVMVQLLLLFVRVPALVVLVPVVPALVALQCTLLLPVLLPGLCYWIRIIMNAPLPGFVLIASLQVANVNVFVGGVEDAFNYSPLAVGVMLDLPRLDPQNRATAAGAYTGVLPPGYTAGNAFQFVITLQGPATLAGGYGQGPAGGC